MVNYTPHRPWTEAEKQARGMRSGRGKLWTNEDVQYLERAIAQGIPVRKIARTLKIKTDRVWSKIANMGLRPQGEGQIWKRKCLNCAEEYEADSPYLRLCPPCRKRA